MHWCGWLSERSCIRFTHTSEAGSCLSVALVSCRSTCCAARQFDQATGGAPLQRRVLCVMMKTSVEVSFDIFCGQVSRKIAEHMEPAGIVLRVNRA